MPGLLPTEVRFQLHLLAQQRVTHIIEAVGVPFENPLAQKVGQRRARQPIRQRVFAQRLHQTVDHRRRRQRLLRRVKAQAAQRGGQPQRVPSVFGQEHRPQHGALAMGDLVYQHPVQALRLGIAGRGSQRQPTTFPQHPPDNRVHVLLPFGRKLRHHQRRLAVEWAGHCRRHRFPIRLRQGRVAQRDHHAVTRLALEVTVRLQELEHPTRRRVLAPEKHFVLAATVRRAARSGQKNSGDCLIYSPYKSH